MLDQIAQSLIALLTLARHLRWIRRVSERKYQSCEGRGIRLPDLSVACIGVLRHLYDNDGICAVEC